MGRIDGVADSGREDAGTNAGVNVISAEEEDVVVVAAEEEDVVVAAEREEEVCGVVITALTAVAVPHDRKGFSLGRYWNG